VYSRLLAPNGNTVAQSRNLLDFPAAL